MAVKITIPESVVHALKIPESKLETSLSEELAVALYADGFLSFGKARQLAGLGKREFARRLGDSCIGRHYTPEELKDDLNYAGYQ